VTEKISMMRTVGTPFNEGNVICLNQKEGLVFVDSGRNVEDTTKFRLMMEKQFQKKASAVIITHSHPDHYFGNEAFRDLPIIASQKAIELLTEGLEKGQLTHEGRQKFVDYMIEGSKQGQVELSEEWHTEWSKNYVNTDIYLPNIGVRDEFTIGHGSEKFQFKVIGGHSECSAYLYNKIEGILITGDNFNCEHRDNGSCMLAKAISGIDILKQFEEMDVTIVIPGHGPAVDKDYITKTRIYLEQMLTRLKELKAKDVPFEKVLKDSSLPEFFEETKPEQWDRILGQWYEYVK
ncbi:MAG: MBL fold metallo-hydrolase, partial [Candidatus Heimdallarchaeota archaeon]